MMIEPSIRYRNLGVVAALLLLVAGSVLRVYPAAAQEGRLVPPVSVDTPKSPATSEVAVLAGGCFWGVQAVFQHVNGVSNAVSGYAGGERGQANYKLVSMGVTGHAEAVEVTFDPRVISYGRVLQMFFSVAHDPTQLNRQGPDTGTQYRSAIFPQNADQARVAEAYMAQISQANTFGRKLATTIERDKAFSAAEEYHQDYLVKHPTQPYIVINDLPKIADLKRLMPEVYRDKPVLVVKTSRP